MKETASYPKVSIIMYTFNRADYIVDTVESIRNQTYQNWELLIIDDGSNDNTEALIAAIADNRLQFYKIRRLGIGGKLKNMGLEKSTGELIAFIDSDDLWETTKLEKQVAALQQYPDAGFSITGGYNFRELHKPVEYFYKQRTGIKYGDVFISFFKSELAAFNQALMLRKECIKVTGNFKEAHPLFHVDFMLNLARHFKGVTLYEPLFFRRLHDTNYSDLNWIQRHYDGIDMLSTYKDFVPPKIFTETLFRSHIHFGEKCLRYKKKRAAIHSFFNSWRCKPFSIVPCKKMLKAVLYSP